MVGACRVRLVNWPFLGHARHSRTILSNERPNKMNTCPRCKSEDTMIVKSHFPSEQFCKCNACGHSCLYADGNTITQAEQLAKQYVGFSRWRDVMSYARRDLPLFYPRPDERLPGSIVARRSHRYTCYVRAARSHALDHSARRDWARQGANGRSFFG